MPVRRRGWPAVVVCTALLSMTGAAALPAGVAHADCSGAGDFGAGSGCPPPGDTSGAGSGESWPPTAVDWPPSQSSDAGDSSGGGSDASKGDTSAPIVLPDGQQPASSRNAAATKDPSATSTPPTPIVPVGAVATGPAPTAIVMPTSSTS